MVSPDDIYGAVFDFEEETFIVHRNDGTTSKVYDFDTDYDFFQKVLDWAEEGSIEYERI